MPTDQLQPALHFSPLLALLQVWHEEQAQAVADHLAHEAHTTAPWARDPTLPTAEPSGRTQRQMLQALIYTQLSTRVQQHTAAEVLASLLTVSVGGMEWIGQHLAARESISVTLALSTNLGLSHACQGQHVFPIL